MKRKLSVLLVLSSVAIAVLAPSTGFSAQPQTQVHKIVQLGHGWGN
ncbi:hypothetical protein HMPREF9413_1060 [Paenibacillus sp. HGF7]|nr:hypothetical protein HMPREF9413_1060 [Paenibacillus sp. HGF7]EPD82046.1 hypothetical protein HMPREF1207_03872 [Paenibacillus sp. HGH0039]